MTTVKVAGYTVDVYSRKKDLPEKSGVYVILCFNVNSYRVLDVGESVNVRERVLKHDREDCWKRNCKYKIKYGYVKGSRGGAEDRRKIERKIRASEKPPCGKI